MKLPESHGVAGMKKIILPLLFWYARIPLHFIDDLEIYYGKENP